MDEIISRQAAIDALEREKTYCTAFRDGYTPINVFEKYNAGLTDGIKALKNLPSAQQWHPITSRPMDEEERKYWNELRGYTLEDDEAVIWSGCPDDGDEVLVCTALGNVYIDTFYSDPDEGCYFEGSGDMDGIVAWMPKPAPYKEER